MSVVVICTGQSLTKEDVDYCRGKAKVIAVSDAIYLAPWADAMVSYDAAWWRAHRDVTYAGPKYMHGIAEMPDLEHVRVARPGGGNSGVLGCHIARALFGHEPIILLGVDLWGTHFFGPHGSGLSNPDEERFEKMKIQWSRLKDWNITNCSPGTHLECFPKAELREVLHA